MRISLGEGGPRRQWLGKESVSVWKEELNSAFWGLGKRDAQDIRGSSFSIHTESGPQVVLGSVGIPAGAWPGYFPS